MLINLDGSPATVQFPANVFQIVEKRFPRVARILAHHLLRPEWNIFRLSGIYSSDRPRFEARATRKNRPELRHKLEWRKLFATRTLLTSFQTDVMFQTDVQHLLMCRNKTFWKFHAVGKKLHKANNFLGTFSQGNVSVTDPRISFDALK